MRNMSLIFSFIYFAVEISYLELHFIAFVTQDLCVNVDPIAAKEVDTSTSVFCY